MIYTGKEIYIAFLILFMFGVGVGLLYDVVKFVVYLFKNNKIFKHIIEALFGVSIGLVFFTGLVFYNYGQFRLYLLLAYLIGFVAERKTISKVFAKMLIVVYNNIVIMFRKLLNTKFMKRILR